jgi:uncharacterized protein (DUF1330 family)
MPEYTNPDPEQFALLKDLPRDRPVHMLNLVRLKDKATYEDGREVSGGKAYAEYGRQSASVFKRFGGRIIWSGSFEFMVIGPAEEKWDVAFIAEYPTGQAFFDMVRDPDYSAIVHHRTAAVLTSRLIRLQPKENGAGFGE